ncbi:hypothetical protein [Caballeronia sp. Sq4a]|uniref:hypothetical protein n=1 Tax=Caballeronia sp. Sq4a TaxID=2878152 RepID=UPI0020BF7940|nr:hypothetical protein [Caballeronia sp. Sq4a]
MTKIELLIAVELLNNRMASLEYSHAQSVAELLLLIGYGKEVGCEDVALRHDLMMAESLVVLKRLDEASERFKKAILSTYFRTSCNMTSERAVSSRAERHDGFSDRDSSSGEANASPGVCFPKEQL